MSESEEIKKKLLQKPEKKKKYEYLSTGSTLLNLACSGRPEGGFIKGKYYFLVGDSNSGKTFLSLTCLAEAGLNPSFANYRFIYDNAEDGALMDIERFFGKRVAEKIEAPAYEENYPVYSTTVDEFYFYIDDAIDREEPFIYILDSMDVLSSEEEIKKFDKNKKEFKKKKGDEENKSKGSYTDGKAKKNTANLRRLIRPLEKSGSILIIINQTREDPTALFDSKTRSGGKSLGFYATIEMWSSVIKSITKVARGQTLDIGLISKIDVKRSRLTGKRRKIEVPIYNSYGIDDIRSCINYLVDKNHWSKNGTSINATDFSQKLTEEKLVDYIEENKLEEKLKSIVYDIWEDIEEAITVKRKKKYE